MLEIQHEHELVTTYDVIHVLHQVPRRLDLVHYLENDPRTDPVLDIGERPVQSLRELRRRADRRRERHYQELHALQQRTSRYQPYRSQCSRRDDHDRNEPRRHRQPCETTQQRPITPEAALPVCLIAEHDSD